MLRSICRYVFILAVSTLLTATVAADFRAPSNWIRSSATNSTYQLWELFSSPVGGTNAPNPASAPAVPYGVNGVGPFANAFNPNGTPNVVNSTADAFITSGGNIYSPTSPLNITASVPGGNLGAGWFTTVVLQTRTQGVVIDQSSVFVTPAGGAPVAPFERTLLFEQSLGGFGGAVQDWLFQFVVPGNAASYNVQFNAAEASLSLDRVSIDTYTNFGQPVFFAAVPEPATWTLLGGTGAVAAAWAWRRQRRAARELDVAC